MKLADALALIANHTPEELRRIPPRDLFAIVEGMTSEEVYTFMFEKNIKVFGGINPWVDDFFEKDTVGRAINTGRRQAVRGTIAMLQRMQSYNHLSEENHARISDAIRLLESVHVQGGARRRRTRRNTRKRTT